MNDCRECRRSFRTPQGLGYHRRRIHGIAGTDPHANRPAFTELELRAALRRLANEFELAARVPASRLDEFGPMEAARRIREVLGE